MRPSGLRSLLLAGAVVTAAPAAAAAQWTGPVSLATYQGCGANGVCHTLTLALGPAGQSASIGIPAGGGAPSDHWQGLSYSITHDVPASTSFMANRVVIPGLPGDYRLFDADGLFATYLCGPSTAQAYSCSSTPLNALAYPLGWVTPGFDASMIRYEAFGAGSADLLRTPEPATVGLTAAGIVALAAFARRRRKS